MDYRVFFLDDDGHVFAREDIIAKNDEEAVRCAFQLLTSHAIEVWHRDRKVALIKAPYLNGLQ